MYTTPILVIAPSLTYPQKLQQLEASLLSKDEQLAVAGISITFVATPHWSIGRDLNKLQMLQQIELDNIRTQQIQLTDQKNSDAYKKYVYNKLVPWCLQGIGFKKS